MRLKNPVLFGAVLFHFLAADNSGFAQGTAFTYQGRLTDQGAPANGIYDLRFTVYDALTAGNPVGLTVDVDEKGETLLDIQPPKKSDKPKAEPATAS